MAVKENTVVAPADAGAVKDETAVTTAAQGQSTAMATPLGGYSGDAMDSMQLQLPRLKTVYGTSALASVHNQGDLVIQIGGKAGPSYLIRAKAEVDPTFGNAARIIILGAPTYWKEYLSQEEWNAGKKPSVYATEAEVLANGGRTGWPRYGSGLPKPTHSPASDLKLLIERPKDVVCSAFAIELDGRVFCPAIWSVDKAAAKSILTTIKSDIGFALRETGLLAATYYLWTEVKSEASVVVGQPPRIRVTPRIRMGPAHSPEVVAKLRALLAKVSTYEPADTDEDDIMPF